MTNRAKLVLDTMRVVAEGHGLQFLALEAADTLHAAFLRGADFLAVSFGPDTKGGLTFIPDGDPDFPWKGFPAAWKADVLDALAFYVTLSELAHADEAKRLLNAALVLRPKAEA